MIVIKKASVLTRHKFVSPSDVEHTKAYDRYIDYIMRNEAVYNDNNEDNSILFYNEFSEKKKKYNHEKLFTSDKDFLDAERLEEYKKLFKVAQKNGSPMWQTVISFDNEWLAKNGLYDEQTQSLNISKMQDVTRKHMNTMLGAENLSDTSVWTGSIHFNTKCVHIHIATVEPFSTRQTLDKFGEKRGSFKLGSILKAKSTVVNDIMNDSEISKEINTIIREKIIAAKKEQKLIDDDVLSNKFLKLYNLLPADKRLWKYNNNAMKDYRPLIDEITTLYLEKYNVEDFRKLKEILANREDNYLQAYGKADKFGSYSDKKIQDLYSRMGNVILKEAIAYEKANKTSFIKTVKKSRSIVGQYKKYRNKKVVDMSIKRLIRSMQDEHEHYINQREFEELEYEAAHSLDEEV